MDKYVKLEDVKKWIENVAKDFKNKDGVVDEHVGRFIWKLSYMQNLPIIETEKVLILTEPKAFNDVKLKFKENRMKEKKLVTWVLPVRTTQETKDKIRTRAKREGKHLYAYIGEMLHKQTLSEDFAEGIIVENIKEFKG